MKPTSHFYSVGSKVLVKWNNSTTEATVLSVRLPDYGRSYNVWYQLRIPGAPFDPFYEHDEITPVGAP